MLADSLNPRKEPGASIHLGLILLLTALGAFGLGRLSMASQEGIGVVTPTETSVVVATTSLDTVVASKTGTKYHLPWCAGAQTIKEENKVWFDTREAARAAGYLPAGNCKGLE